MIKSLSLINDILQRPAASFHITSLGSLSRVRTRLAKAYADWRVGATRAEKRAYKPSDTVLFTFDDYGTAQQVTNLLAVLKREGIKAMFFIQGDWAQENPGLVEAIASEGHIVGNHTYSHPDLLSLTDNEVRAEITGGPKSIWLRPPRGRYNARVKAIARSLGYAICYWTVDSDDWQETDPKVITHNVLSQIHPGAVILFHIHSDATAQVLPSLTQAIRDLGLTITSPAAPDWEPKS